MDAVIVGLLLALEVALLLAVALVVLVRKHRRLRQRLKQLPGSEESGPAFASVASGYLPYLDKEILDTRAQLELTGSETVGDGGVVEALASRLALLESEKKVAELCNDYPDRRWEHIRACFAPFIEPEDAQAGVEAAPDEEQGNVRHIDTLQGALSGQADAIQSLQHLLLQARQAPDESLVEQMEKHIAQLERQAREANTCVEIMEQENQRLHHQVDGAGLRAGRAVAEVQENMVELQQKLDARNHAIAELRETVDRLKAETEQAHTLQARVEQMERADRDMSMCVETLEEENEFLQEQIRALLKLEQDQALYQGDEPASGAPAQPELEQLQEELRARDEQLKTLEQKYAAMEQEYLTLYEEANS